MFSDWSSSEARRRAHRPALRPRVRTRFRLCLHGALLLALLPLAGGLVACGKKGPPLPPLRIVPAQIQDLDLRQEGALMQLEMAYPATTVAGMALGGVDSVELWVLSKPIGPDGDPPLADANEFEAGARKLLTLRGSELESAIVGRRIQLRLPVEVPETPAGDIYAVRTTKGDEVSAYSNRVTLVPAAPPEPPTDLALEPGPDGIEIRWSYDDEAEGFLVFRRAATERGYAEPIQRLPGDQRAFLDESVRLGERYIYTLRAIGSREPLILSEPTGDREVDYEDRFAPPLPENFVALPATRSVRLRWDPSDADDVTGYRVYRREPGRREFRPLTQEPLDALEYIDSGLSAGLRFEYRLQVIDHSGNESQLSDPVTATPR